MCGFSWLEGALSQGAFFFAATSCYQHHLLPARAKPGTSTPLMHGTTYVLHLPFYTSMLISPASALSRRDGIWLLTGILIIAINLRSALGTVGPLTSDIRAATGLSNSLIGLLTTLPMLAFAAVSLWASLITRKLGAGLTLAISLLLLSVGIAMRAIDSTFLLYAGTAILGISIAFGNVLLPTLTKEYFPRRSDMVTGLYTAVMAIGTSLAAGASVPLSRALGWRGTLGIWAIPAFIALLVWLPQIRRIKKAAPQGSFLRSMHRLAQKPLAWKIAFFMGLQSYTAYIVLAWLPDIFQSAGYDANFSGWMLSLGQAAGIFGSLIVPLLTAGSLNQHRIVLLFCGIETIGVLGLLFLPATLPWLWVFAIGFPLGAYFTLALLFFVVRSRDTLSTTELSGMAQSFGYLIAAPGPIIFGAIFDLTGSWTWPLISLLLIIAAKLYTGWGAGRDVKL